MTAQEYLQQERVAEFRHGFYNGRIYSMPVNPFTHAVIGSNLSAELSGALLDRDCFVAAFDMRTRVNAHFYTYPDLVVACGRWEFAANRSFDLEAGTG